MSLDTLSNKTDRYRYNMRFSLELISIPPPLALAQIFFPSHLSTQLNSLTRAVPTSNKFQKVPKLKGNELSYLHLISFPNKIQFHQQK